MCEQARRWEVTVTQLVHGADCRDPQPASPASPHLPYLSVVLSVLANFESSFKNPVLISPPLKLS